MKKCANCNKEIKGTGKTGLCSSCVKKGKPLSSKHKKKIQESCKKTYSYFSKEERTKKFSSNASGFKHCQSKEVRKKINQTMSKKYKGEGNPFFGKKHSEESKKKMSEMKAKLLAEGKIQITKSSFGRKGWYFSRKNNEKFYHDSALELMRMEQLDADNTVIKWTKRHGIKIKLKNDRNFVPDFLIEKNDGSIILEETKGYDPYYEYKKEAMKKYCEKNNFVFNWIDQSDMKGYREWLKDTLS